MALVDYETLPYDETKKVIMQMTRGYSDKKAYFVDQLSMAWPKLPLRNTHTRSSCV